MSTRTPPKPRVNRAHASIQVRRSAGIHDPEKRARLVEWLREQADFLEQRHEEIAPSFRARLCP